MAVAVMQGYLCTCACECACAYTRACARACARACVRVRADVPVLGSACVRACARASARVCVCACVFVRACQSRVEAARNGKAKLVETAAYTDTELLAARKLFDLVDR
eukprot:3479391-Pleurochrysis_carterae.AAC.3